jgi:hypothetical protein
VRRRHGEAWGTSLPGNPLKSEMVTEAKEREFSVSLKGRNRAGVCVEGFRVGVGGGGGREGNDPSTQKQALALSRG